MDRSYEPVGRGFAPGKRWEKRRCRPEDLRRVALQSGEQLLNPMVVCPLEGGAPVEARSANTLRGVAEKGSSGHAMRLAVSLYCQGPRCSENCRRCICGTV